jgi:methylmalonyl-CoA mutase N-terminal domain/subunit
VVGVTTFQTGESATIPIFSVDPEIERAQQARIAAVRARRNAAAWRASLDAIRDAAKGDTNLVPLVVAAVEARATVGEISDTLRVVFGEHCEAMV